MRSRNIHAYMRTRKLVQNGRIDERRGGRCASGPGRGARATRRTGSRATRQAIVVKAASPTLRAQDAEVQGLERAHVVLEAPARARRPRRRSGGRATPRASAAAAGRTARRAARATARAAGTRRAGRASRQRLPVLEPQHRRGGNESVTASPRLRSRASTFPSPTVSTYAPAADAPLASSRPGRARRRARPRRGSRPRRPGSSAPARTPTQTGACGRKPPSSCAAIRSPPSVATRAIPPRDLAHRAAQQVAHGQELRDEARARLLVERLGEPTCSIRRRSSPRPGR